MSVPLLGRIRKGGRQLRDLIRILPQASAPYGKGPFWTFRRGLHLTRRGWFAADEALALGLFDPEVDPVEARGYVAKQRMTVLQNRLNPGSWQEFVRDKGLFYRYCQAAGIPIPRLLALAYREGVGWTEGPGLVVSPEEWGAFLRTGLPEEFVLKPTQGYHGQGVRVLRREGDGFVDDTGARRAVGQLMADLRDPRSPHDFLIQERLHGHPALAEVSGSRALQTVRIMTLFGGSGQLEVLGAALRLGGTGPVDNFDLGRTGNLFAEVDLSSGRLLRAWGSETDRPGLSPLTCHPRTGRDLTKVTIPFWQESVALSKRMARLFLPMRTLGWDVGITPDGPRVIEANVWWDPLPFPGMAQIARRVAAAVGNDTERGSP